MGDLALGLAYELCLEDQPKGLGRVKYDTQAVSLSETPVQGHLYHSEKSLSFTFVL